MQRSPINLLVLVALSLASFCQANGDAQTQMVLESPSDQQARIGDQVLLKCKFKNLRGEPQWCIDDFCLGVSKKDLAANTGDSLVLKGRPRHRIIGNKTRGEFHLLIEPVQLQDNMYYYCMATAASETIKAVKSKKAFVTVLSKSRNPKADLTGLVDQSVLIDVSGGLSLSTNTALGQSHPRVTEQTFNHSMHGQAVSTAGQDPHGHQWSANKRRTEVQDGNSSNTYRLERVDRRWQGSVRFAYISDTCWPAAQLVLRHDNQHHAGRYNHAHARPAGRMFCLFVREQSEAVAPQRQPCDSELELFPEQCDEHEICHPSWL